MYPTRRRRSPVGPLLIILLLLLAGGIVYLATVDTSVPTSRMEQDVTNALPAR